MGGGKRPGNKIFSTQTEELNSQNQECDNDGEDESKIFLTQAESSQSAPSTNYDPKVTDPGRGWGQGSSRWHDTGRGGTSNRSTFADCSGKCGDKHPRTLQYFQVYKNSLPTDTVEFATILRLCKIWFFF